MNSALTADSLPVAAVAKYTANLAALARVQPGLADRIEESTIPPTAQFTVGRDGAPTWKTPRTGRFSPWLGDSSMPTVSAPAFAESARVDGTGLWLAGIGCGLEPLLILERLPSHAAVFIIQRDWLPLKLAWHVYDYSAAIGAGRCVFLPADDLESALARFLSANPGYELPRQLLPAPSFSTAQTADMQRSVELACETAVNAQLRLLESVVERLSRANSRSPDDSPRLAVLSVDARAWTADYAARIAGALDHLGRHYRTCVPDHPGKCHIVARLTAVEQAEADLVLFINGGAESMLELLPPRIAIAEWYLPDAIIPERFSAAHAARVHVFASNQAIADQLTARGATASRTHLCELAVRDVQPRFADANQPTPNVNAIAIMFDLPDDRPEAAGISLQSHVQLWQSARSLARAAASAQQLDETNLFTRAQRETGTAIDDPAQRAHWLGLIRARIIPTAVAVADLRALQSSGFKPLLVGANWHLEDEARGLPCDSSPVASNRAAFAVHGAVVLPSAAPAYVQLALDLASAGRHVILRTLAAPLTTQYPALASLTGVWKTYTAPAELVVHVRVLTHTHRDESAHLDAVCEPHRVSARLRQIERLVR